MLRASLQDFLQGAKKTGVRRFTDGAPDGFFRKPAVLLAIRARHHSPIRGFVPQNRKTREEFCAILDLRAGGSPGPRPSRIPSAGIGSAAGEFAPFLRTGKNARAILRGPPDLLAPSAASGGMQKGRPPRGVPPPPSCGVASCATYHSRETAFCPSRRKDAG